jgi:hypothetical protein
MNNITGLILLAAGAYLAIGFYQCYVANPAGSNVAGNVAASQPAHACSNQNFGCVLNWPWTTYANCSYGNIASL